MTTRKTISVLICTYNGERFIQQQLDSVAKQSSPPDEIIVCDDCSTDGTLEVVNRFAIEYGTVNLKIFTHSENLGYAKNFLRGISYCNGDYIAFCDQDDIWLNEKLETMTNKLAQHGWPGFAFSDCLIVDEKLQGSGKLGSEFIGINPDEMALIKAGRLFELLCSRPRVTGMTMICRLDDLRRSAPPSESIAHDYLFSTAYAARRDYIYVDKPLVLYRQHGANVVGMNIKSRNRSKKYQTQESLLRDLKDKINLLRYALNFVSSKSIDPAYQAYALEQINWCEARISRRLSFSSLLGLRSCQPPSKLSARERRKMWLKDLRCNLRLKLIRA